MIDGPGDGDLIVALEHLRELGRLTLAADPRVIESRVARLTPDSLAT